MVFRALLCLLILGVHTHCVLTHGAELRSKEGCAGSPIDDRHDCENESSCICKGATLGDTTSIPVAQPLGWACITHPALVAFATFYLADVRNWLLHPPPPQGARVARALLQTFLI